jgi:hypothetical protein
VEELPASIPGVGGVIKNPTQPDHVLNIEHSDEIRKKNKKKIYHTHRVPIDKQSSVFPPVLA